MTTTPLRCPHKLHGDIDGDTIVVKCSSRFCGHGAGVVVLHCFDLQTGQLVKTAMFKDPNPRKKRK